MKLSKAKIAAVIVLVVLLLSAGALYVPDKTVAELSQRLCFYLDVSCALFS
jgi:hypothetical protein